MTNKYPEPPVWWPAWQAYKEAQREYEAAIEGLAGIGPQANSGWTMERIRKDIMPRRNAAFDAFRATYSGQSPRR